MKGPQQRPSTTSTTRVSPSKMPVYGARMVLTRVTGLRHILALVKIPMAKPGYQFPPPRKTIPRTTSPSTILLKSWAMPLAANAGSVVESTAPERIMIIATTKGAL